MLIPLQYPSLCLSFSIWPFLLHCSPALLPAVSPWPQHHQQRHGHGRFDTRPWELPLLRQGPGQRIGGRDRGQRDTWRLRQWWGIRVHSGPPPQGQKRQPAAQKEAPEAGENGRQGCSLLEAGVRHFPEDRGQQVLWPRDYDCDSDQYSEHGNRVPWAG